MKAMTHIRLIFLAVVLATLVSTAGSQVTLQFGAGAGLAFPMGDYGGQTTDYYAGSKYGLSMGYTVQAKGRVGLAGFTLVGGIGYEHLSNSGEGEEGRGKVDVAQSVVTIKAGPEFRIPIPGAPFTPYIGGSIAWHSISGETTFQGLTKVPSGSFDVEAASRFGLGVNAGVLIKLGGTMTLDVGADYAFVNPLTKEWKVVDPKSDARVNSYKALNDDKDPLYVAGNDDHFIAGSRSISLLHVTATLMFGF